MCPPARETHPISLCSVPSARGRLVALLSGPLFCVAFSDLQEPFNALRGASPLSTAWQGGPPASEPGEGPLSVSRRVRWGSLQRLLGRPHVWCATERPTSESHTLEVQGFVRRREAGCVSCCLNSQRERWLSRHRHQTQMYLAEPVPESRNPPSPHSPAACLRVRGCFCRRGHSFPSACSLPVGGGVRGGRRFWEESPAWRRENPPSSILPISKSLQHEIVREVGR